MAARDSHIFPSKGSSNSRKKTPAEETGSGGDSLHLWFPALQRKFASSQCLLLFEWNSGSPVALTQKLLPAGIAKGEFQLVCVLDEGVCIALYKFDGTAAYCNVGCTKRSQLPTPKHSPISLNLSLPHVVFLTMEEECENDDNPSPQARQEEKENTSIPLSSPIVITVLLKYFKRVFFQDTNQRNMTKMKTPTCIQKHDVRMTLTTTHAQTGLAAGAAFFLCCLPFWESTTEQWDRVTVDEHGSEGLEFC